MRSNAHHRLQIIHTSILVSIVVACVPTRIPESPIPSADRNLPLTPYQSSTPVRKVTEAPTKTSRISSPTPTATQIIYKVVEGDTMLGIAIEFGVTLDELLVANTEVDQRFLSIDTLLVIPVSENRSTIFATPTPLPIKVDDPECYAVLEGGVFCFAVVYNNLQYSLEALSAKVTLVTLDGQDIVNGVAHAPIDLLPTGSAMPLVVYFPPLVVDEFIPQIGELFAIPMLSANSRHIQLEFANKEVAYSSDGSMATVSGDAIIPHQGLGAGVVSVVAVAYSENDRVVGVRRVDQEGWYQSGDIVPFEVAVYSLGPAIKQIDILGEARP